MMARSLLLAALCLSTLPGVVSTARANIDFAEAAAIAREALPSRPLVDVRIRERRNGTVFKTASLNEFGTLTYPLEIDAATGEVDAGETEEVFPPEDLEMLAVLERLPLCELDFAEAVALANGASGRSEADIARVSLQSEFFMILYEVRYTDNTSVMVDGVTGTVFGDDDTPTAQHALEHAQFQGLFALARSLVTGPYTVAYSADTLVTPAGPAMSARFLNPANGRVRQVDVLRDDVMGDQATITTFTALGSLAERIAVLRPELPSVVVDAAGFLGFVELNFPAGRVAGVKLDSRLRNGIMRTRWTCAVLDAAGSAVDFSVDATVPLGQGVPLVQPAAQRRLGDLNGDGAVGVADLSEMLAAAGEDYPPHDLTFDGTVDGADLAVLLSNWGAAR